MSRGITYDTVMLWRTIAVKGGWWSVLRLTREWAPTYSLAEVEQHLVTLWRGKFLAAEFNQREGSVYAFTASCLALPDQLIPNDAKPNFSALPEPRRPDVMTTSYCPPKPSYRAGALDHAKCPSLFMGKRLAFREIANG